jgi:L-lysine 2,3-aminomutase
VHRSYHDTVSVFAPPGPAGSFGITCPGRDWPAAGPDPVLAAADMPRLAGYLTAHPEVCIVELAGADLLTMDTPALRRYIEPLLAVEHLVSVRLRTAVLARWPHRFLAGPDADRLLRLFEQVCAGGKTLTLTTDWSHPRELEPGPAREAVRRIHGTGAVIHADGALAGTVNDASAVWAQMWRNQVRLGIIPCTVLLMPVTGPARHFTVTLARALQIFARAYASVSGLARTVRGPAMRDAHGLVCIDGIAVAGGQKVFVLRYLQARDLKLASTPFFAIFSADASRLTDLQFAQGTRLPARLDPAGAE